MGFNGPSDDGGGPTTLSEINITPMVDVMLVLLTIFMVASSVETIQVKQRTQAILQEQVVDRKDLRELERLRRPRFVSPGQLLCGARGGLPDEMLPIWFVSGQGSFPSQRLAHGPQESFT